jgi:hypothetical protein
MSEIFSFRLWMMRRADTLVIITSETSDNDFSSQVLDSCGIYLPHFAIRLVEELNGQARGDNRQMSAVEALGRYLRYSLESEGTESGNRSQAEQ